MPAGRLMAEIVIEGDDAMHLGAGDVQRVGDQRLGRLVDIAELGLQGVQDRQERTFAVRKFANERLGDLRIPGGLVRVVSVLMHA